MQLLIAQVDHYFDTNKLQSLVANMNCRWTLLFKIVFNHRQSLKGSLLIGKVEGQFGTTFLTWLSVFFAQKVRYSWSSTLKVLDCLLSFFIGFPLI
jgi:hypothetical protein